MKHTVLVKYYQWVEADHWAFDPVKQHYSKIVKVNDLEEINDLFQNAVIKNVKILDCTEPTENCP